jgi:hypothetical protein
MQAEIKVLLKNISASAERALGRARERRAAGAEAVKAELARLEHLHQETEALVPPHDHDRTVEQEDSARRQRPLAD